MSTPNLAFGAVSLAGLDPHRGGTKTYKAELLRRQEYDTLLLGSSRTEVGIDPASEAWGTATVFDASVPGTNMWETRQVLSFAMSRHTPTHVVLFADFLMFNDRRSTTGSFTRSRFSSDLNAIEYTLAGLSLAPATTWLLSGPPTGGISTNPHGHWGPSSRSLAKDAKHDPGTSTSKHESESPGWAMPCPCRQPGTR